MAPIVALPTLPSHPRCPPRSGLHRACSLWAQSCGPCRTLSPVPPHCRFVLEGGGALSAPPYLHPPPLRGAEVCGGEGTLSSSLRCTLVAGTTQARRRHKARHLSLRRGGGMPCGSHRRPSYPAFAPPVVPPLGLAQRVLPTGTVVWSVPHPLAAASPPCRFVLGEGGRFLPPPTCIPHPGGAEVCVFGGGGRPCRLPFVARTSQARRGHGAGTRRGTCPSAGVGGLPCVTRHRPSYPACAPPGGRRCVRGGGALVVVPSVHACRRHDASTTQARGESLGCSGGGVSPLGLPALLHGIGSAPEDLQPLLPLGGSRHVSAWCSVSRACSLPCPYLLEQVRTRVETDDEKVRAAGRNYRTPRRLLAPSAALVEGRAPVSASSSLGGGDCPSSPWCLCIHFRAA